VTNQLKRTNKKVKQEELSVRKKAIINNN